MAIVQLIPASGWWLVSVLWSAADGVYRLDGDGVCRDRIVAFALVKDDDDDNEDDWTIQPVIDYEGQLGLCAEDACIGFVHGTDPWIPKEWLPLAARWIVTRNDQARKTRARAAQ